MLLFGRSDHLATCCGSCHGTGLGVRRASQEGAFAHRRGGGGEGGHLSRSIGYGVDRRHVHVCDVWWRVASGRSGVAPTPANGCVDRGDGCHPLVIRRSPPPPTPTRTGSRLPGEAEGEKGGANPRRRGEDRLDLERLKRERWGGGAYGE